MPHCGLKLAQTQSNVENIMTDRDKLIEAMARGMRSEGEEGDPLENWEVATAQAALPAAPQGRG